MHLSPTSKLGYLSLNQLGNKSRYMFFIKDEIKSTDN